MVIDVNVEAIHKAPPLPQLCRTLKGAITITMKSANTEGK